MRFRTDLILTCVSGKMLMERMSLKDFNKVMGDMLSFLTQDWPELWQLQRFADECKPYIIDQLPWLKEVLDRDEWEYQREWWAENCRTFLQEIEEKYGSEHELAPIPADDHEHINPAVEFAQRFPDLVIHTKTDPNNASNN